MYFNYSFFLAAEQRRAMKNQAESSSEKTWEEEPTSERDEGSDFSS